MTYFGFLLRFLLIPIIILLALTWFDKQRGKTAWPTLQSFPGGWAIALHVVVALIYTTPWDNYLVATGVWYYNPNLVTGITIGWVPIEEYTFFVLQPIMTGLWVLWLSRNLRFTIDDLRLESSALRSGLLGAGTVFWAVTAVLLIMGYAPATYFALIFVWATPPILLQLWFGADILWKYGRLVFLGIVPPTLYLAFADSLAIGDGTWTIDPAQSFNVFLGGVLPIEEFLFFMVTNVLITVGITLLLARESQERILHYTTRLKQIWLSRSTTSRTRYESAHE